MIAATPLITVLLPVYNGQLYLHEAIDSILRQTFTDFEFIIINDGSTDHSEEIILSYADNRIRYVKNEHNIKLIATLNKGFGLARGKYIARMDADDYSYSERLEKQFKFMEANPEIALAGSWFELVGDSTRIVKYESDTDSIRFKMLYQTQFCHPTVILRKAVTDSLPILFDPDYAHAEDYELFSRMAYSFKVSNIPEVLLKYRLHSGNVSVLHRNVQVENSVKIRISNFNNIGVTANNEEAYLFEKLAYQNYVGLIDGLNTIHGLLLKIIVASKNNRGINGQLLKDYATVAWFNTCYNLLGKVKNISTTFFNSEITKGYIKPQAKIRFIIKSIVVSC